MLSLAPTVNSARMYVLPSKSRTPPRDDQDDEVVLYPSYWFVSLLNLIDPSAAKPVGLSAEVPTGITNAVFVFTFASLPAKGVISKS